jgi:hypothetical protein
MGLNLLTIYFIIRKFSLIPKIVHSSFDGVIIMIVVIIFNLIFYNLDNRYLKVIDKYMQENQMQKRKGTRIFIFYVVLTICSFVLGALYKPGII